MSLDSPIAKLGGWRYRHFQTKRDLRAEIEDLEKIRDRLKHENEVMRTRLWMVAQVAHAGFEVGEEDDGRLRVDLAPVRVEATEFPETRG